MQIQIIELPVWLLGLKDQREGQRRWTAQDFRTPQVRPDSGGKTLGVEGSKEFVFETFGIKTFIFSLSHLL